MIKKILKSTLLALLLVAFISMPVLAAYQALVQIVTTTAAYDMLPGLLPMDNTLMVTNNYIDADGLDVQVEKSGAPTPRMLADDKTLFASQLGAASTTNFYYTTDNTPEVFDILTGYGGNITITDDDTPAQETLELGSDFEIEQSGYVDTDYDTDKNLVYKEDAFRTYISAEGEITSEFGFPQIVTVNGGNDVVNQVNHTINLPAGIVAGDLILVFFASDGTPGVTAFPGGWTQLFWGADALTSVKFGAWYRIADGSEGATIVVTTTANQMTAHTTYRITSYFGVPEVGAFTTSDSDSPNPPSLTPSWGALDTLWIACEGNDDLDTVNTYPASYTDGRNDFANHAEGCGVGTARRELNSVSEDPGVFTLTGAEGWIANTVAIRPVPIITATGISSGEYTVKTYGVANEPAWATGDVLHFTGAADSNVNAGAIHDNIAKLWVSLWFKLDSTFSAASATDQFIWGKFNGAADYVYAYLESDDGILYFQFDDGVNPFSLESTTVSWTADTWYHIITSLSDTAPAQRLLVNGVAQDTDTVAASNTPNGGDFCFGDFDDPGAVTGFIGEIQNVIVGIGDLSVAEEDALFTGIAPIGANAPTNYWYTDEGTGTGVDIVRDYGSAPSLGDVDAACSWETATFTTGSTGRLCDFYIEVDDGVTDPDRWGANLKGATVAPNGNDWLLNQNNVMPWMDYYYHTVGGVLHAWYQPNDIVEATDHDGVEDVGGSDTTITDATMTEAPGYWIDALVTITASAGAAMGESRVCTVFAAGGVITVAPAFSANIAFDDEFTIDFGTLIDRSYYGLEFDGIDGMVNCGNDPSLQFSTSNITVETWFKDPVKPVGDSSFIFKYDGAGVGWYLLLRPSDNSYLWRPKSVYYALGIDVDDGNWHHICVSQSGTIASCYIDGTALAPMIGCYENTSIVADFFIGGIAANFAEIKLDLIRVYDRALEEEEILYSYNGGAGRYTPYSTTGLVGQWQAEEGSGLSLADSSVEGNTGTLQGGTSWVNGFVSRPAGNAGTNDSRITWGVNPADITLLLGSLYSTIVTVPATAGAAQDIIPETPVFTLFGMTAPDNMFSPLFDTFADVINLPSVILWVTVSMLFVVGGTVAFYFLTKNGTYSAFVGVFLLAICVVMGTVPWWTIIIGMLIAVYAAIARSRQVA